FGDDVRVLCPMTCSPITKAQSHVDHEPPATFDALVRGWLEEAGLAIESIEISGFEDGQIERGFVDPAVERSWVEYHRARAKLRVVSIRANLSDVRKSILR